MRLTAPGSPTARSITRSAPAAGWSVAPGCAPPDASWRCNSRPSTPKTTPSVASSARGGGVVGPAGVPPPRRFLALQQQAVDAEDDPIRGVVAAADAPAVFSE